MFILIANSQVENAPARKTRTAHPIPGAPFWFAAHAAPLNPRSESAPAREPRQRRLAPARPLERQEGLFDAGLGSVGQVEGEIVTARGTVTLEKDLGAGYFYPVLLEDARLAK